MSKLCNVNHDNLEACKDSERQFLPTLKEFFEEAIEQLDPANQVDKEYQLVNQTDWAWKSLRLLAKRSSLYFMQNQNVKTISEYLEAICNKLGKEFAAENPQSASHHQIASLESVRSNETVAASETNGHIVKEDETLRNVKVESEENENSQGMHEFDDLNEEQNMDKSTANPNLHSSVCDEPTEEVSNDAIDKFYEREHTSQTAVKEENDAAEIKVENNQN